MINVLARPSAARQARRASRHERTRLRAEIASYRTPAERAELHAILDRHSEADTQVVRRLIR